VLPARNLRMEPGAELDERRNASVDAHHAARRLRDSRDELQRRALAGSIPADDAVRGAFWYGKRHIGERREHFAGLQVAQNASLQQRALERGELPSAVATVDFRDVIERDRVRGHTASANESRSRSNTQYAPRNRINDTPPSASSHRQCPIGPW